MRDSSRGCRALTPPRSAASRKCSSTSATQEQNRGCDKVTFMQCGCLSYAITSARRQEMALTRSFKELVQKRIVNDPAFGEALLREGIDSMLAGDVDTGKEILRDYIKATVGFEKLAEATGTQPKSLSRMFRPRGNPQARHLFGVIGYLQKQAGVELHVMQGPR